MSGIGDVENAMVARLAAAGASGAVSYAYRSAGTWPKDFDSDQFALDAQYPACWAAFGGAHRVERQGLARWKVDCVFAMVVAAKNLRNEEARRHGGTAAEPGSYQLATDALQLLAGQTLGLDIQPLVPASILPVETAEIPRLKQVSIYAVHFETSLFMDSPPAGNGVDDFAAFHADWDPAPFGHVDPAHLPDDAHAIGADHVTLETP